MSVLEGEFAGFKNCREVVYTLKNKDLVSFIGVQFKEHNSWSAIYNNYASLKEMLTTKYGKPTDVIEMFQGSYVEDDTSRMVAVIMDRCKYITTFETELGTIQLFISKYDYRYGCVMMKYTDKANNALVRDAAMEDL